MAVDRWGQARSVIWKTPRQRPAPDGDRRRTREPVSVGDPHGDLSVRNTRLCATCRRPASRGPSAAVSGCRRRRTDAPATTTSAMWLPCRQLDSHAPGAFGKTSATGLWDSVGCRPEGDGCHDGVAGIGRHAALWADAGTSVRTPTAGGQRARAGAGVAVPASAASPAAGRRSTGRSKSLQTLQVTGFVANAPMHTSQPRETTWPHTVRRTSVGRAARCTIPFGDSSVIRMVASANPASSDNMPGWCYRGVDSGITSGHESVSGRPRVRYEDESRHLFRVPGEGPAGPA